MTAIAPNHEPGQPAGPCPTLQALWAQLWRSVGEAMQTRQAHPARSVLLLPFFQLQAVARQTWQIWQSDAHAGPVGFAPRIDTTQSWQQRLTHFEPQALDIGFDAGLDSLRARSWLAQAGLAEHSRALTPLLVEAAQQLGSLAACVPPEQRSEWAACLRPLVAASGAPSFAQHETAVAQIALEWAAASAYASDVLLQAGTAAQVDLLMVVRGVQSNALSLAVAQQQELHKPGSVIWLDLPQASSGTLWVHAAQDAEDEAERACACVLQAIDLGQTPVALPAIDRQATRRISAMLHERGVPVADETGWRLSTTRAAASVLSLLRAAHWQATPDEQLDWLKHCEVDAPAVQRWEQALRGQNTPPAGIQSAQSAIKFIASGELPDALLAQLRSPRVLAEWLVALRRALRVCGQWMSLAQDAAGQQVLQVLQLDRVQPSAIVMANAGRMSLADLTQWVQAALEGASFKPSLDREQAQVVILPLAQMAARPFACAVLAGADEQRLPLAPEPQGLWTRSQRASLGLPSREQLALEQQLTWQRVMQVPLVQVLWRRAQGDEVLQPSPLLQAWQLAHAASVGEDARLQVMHEALPQSQPAPRAAALAVNNFSASSYTDLRACPYRYFALRLLGLQEAAELDDELSKREFGAWLHDVLSEFHRLRPVHADAQRDTPLDNTRDAALLDACAARCAEPMQRDAGFVPFAASWPQVRNSYLLWLGTHEAKGWRFEGSEQSMQCTLSQADAGNAGDAVLLKGRLDRIDFLPTAAPDDGVHQRWVMDYKTEPTAALKKRVAQPLEDTQLVFYVALLGHGDQGGGQSAQASYVALSEKTTVSVLQPLASEALPLLLQGLARDAQRMQSGHALPAMGEGKACVHCAARGLCRKDSWSVAA